MDETGKVILLHVIIVRNTFLFSGKTKIFTANSISLSYLSVLKRASFGVARHLNSSHVESFTKK